MITTYNSTNGMICPNCKCEIPESSKFCNQCGCEIVSTRQNSRCDLRPYIENGKFGAMEERQLLISTERFSLQDYMTG